MKRGLRRNHAFRGSWPILAGLLALPLPLAGAPLDLSQVPLSQPTSESTRVPIKPNLMFILDDSGSMGQNYTPDYVSTYPGYPYTSWSPGAGGDDERHCLDSLDDSDANYDLCLPGDPPFMSNDFNAQYYDPTITYSPGVGADGTPKTSMNAANTADWTQVPFDAYGRQNVGMLSESGAGNKTNLASGFYDRVWCDSDSPLSLADPAHCKRNTSYLYPDAVYGFGRRPFLASPRSYFYVQGAPYYYRIGVGEHCSDAALTDCVAATAPTGAYVYPARVRWCNSAARTTCQGRNTPAFRYVKFSALSTGGIAKGTIVVGNSGSDSSAAINDIRVGTVSVVGTTVTAGSGTNAASERSAVAQAIRSAINAYVSVPDYVACDGSQSSCTLPGGGDAPDGTVVVAEAGTPGAANGLTIDVSSPSTPVARSYAKLQFTTVNKGSTGAELRSVKVNGVEVLGTTLTASNASNAGNRRIDMAYRVCTAINSYSNGVPWEYDAAAASSGSGCPTGSSVLYVRAPFAQGSNPNNLTVTVQFTNGIEYRINDGNINVQGAMTGGAYASVPTTTTAMGGGGFASSTFSRVDITPTGFPRSAAATRKDCVAVSGQCSYSEEMTNFANWYAYYRTRMQLMKTAAGQSFASLGSNYRVGFTTINNTTTGTEYLQIKDFDSAQKSTWYTTLYSIAPGSGTPLRHALSRVGRLFAGKKPFGPDSGDPMQYACQQNFALLTTDGYWNENWDTGIKEVDDATQIGNADGAASVPRPYYDGGLGGTCGPGANFGSRSSSCGTLADVAYHYYATDLRTVALGNCTGSPVGATTYDVCENKVKGNGEDSNAQQHMTTFTLGLGVDGTLDFREDYKTAASGDYKDIKDGLKNWPPVKNLDPTAVDDLWHAAVNGRGAYLSARNPSSLSSGLSNALAGIKVREAAGAAAATSNLEPVAGDNFSYVASYTTNKWTGNLEAREIDTASGQTREQALWCAEDVAAKVDKNTAACEGTLKNLVAAASDARAIYAFSSATASKLRSLVWANLSTAEQAFFDASKLSQYSTWSADEKTAATGASLLNYVRGQFGTEDQDGNTLRLYRNRESTLGDIVGSQPVYVGRPPFDYADAGYAAFKTSGAARTKAVYVAANDGMLHAFNADLPANGGGRELWAYVPSVVMSGLYRLADKNYTSDHRFFVDGSPSVGDVCSGGFCKTILVGGFNAGGKGYYALDVTDPANPKGLWELTTAVDADVGYSFGNPVITKRPDGRWVVLVTSGLNNIGSGRGYLYVLDAGDGTVLSKIDTGVGTAAAPSGLGRITGFAMDASADNTVRYVYGGDLLGNVWRFDLLTPSAVRVGRLKDASGNPQPITTRPMVTVLDNSDPRRMVFVGTGQLAEVNDLSDTQVQTVYGFRDDYDSTGLAIGDCGTCSNGARDELVQQVLSNTGTTDAKGRALRTVTVNTVDLASKAGWYVDLPQLGERVNVDMALTAKVLTFGSNAPKDDICTTGGDSFLTSLDYRTGSLVPGATYASTKIGNAFIVGLVILRTDGGYVITATKSDDPTPEVIGSVPGTTGSTAFQGRRVTWREVDN